MKNIYLTIITSALLSLSAQAESLQTLSKEDSQINVAQVQKTIVLKDAKGYDDSTRISLVIHDNGGSTDVSPHLGLYLIFWKDGEMSNTSAAFDLGSTFQVVDMKSVPGKLVLKIKELGDRGFVIKTQTIDYSDFAKKFEKEAGRAADFDNTWVQGSIESVQN
jgi:hypothetical protein